MIQFITENLSAIASVERVTNIVEKLCITIVGGIILYYIKSKINFRKKIITISTKQKIYASHTSEGVFSFDYSSNNGLYIISDGEKIFATKWSKASNTSIHAYNDSNDINEIALIKNVGFLKDLKLLEGDFSSRSRTPQIGDAIIWKNKNGNYAITKVLKVMDDTRGDKNDMLECEYIIL